MKHDSESNGNDEVMVEAGKLASRHGKDFEKTSPLVQNRAVPPVELRWSDVLVGELLGEGAFNRVFEARLSEKALKRGRFEEMMLNESTSNNYHNSSTTTTSSNTIDNDENDGSCASRSQTRQRKFALKHLDPNEEHENYAFSAIDIVLEGKLLSCLNHQHIIRLYGVTAGSVSKAMTKRGYFLLLDRLDTTLDDKLTSWARHKRERQKDPNIPSVSPSTMMERFQQVCVGVASALHYMHKHGVIFRDLKPANVGFVTQDMSTPTRSDPHHGQHHNQHPHGNPAQPIVKVFDFGLAREVEKDPNVLMTGYTGSARYMAPEVALSQRYGLSADVYSFGILAWQVCTLRKPFHTVHTKDDFMTQVVIGNTRPSVRVFCNPKEPDCDKAGASLEVSDLLESCWHADPSQRPDFDAIERVLQKVTKERNGSSNSTRNSTGRTSSSSSSLSAAPPFISWPRRKLSKRNSVGGSKSRMATGPGGALRNLHKRYQSMTGLWSLGRSHHDRTKQDRQS